MRILNINQKGFTMMELLVVIGLIGILSAGMLYAVDPIAQLQKGKDSEKKGELTQIQSALEMYRTDSGTYPGDIYNGAACGSAKLSWTNPTTGSVLTYMKNVPCDPSTVVKYNYSYDATTKSYILAACLLRTPDPDGVTGCPIALGCAACPSNRFYVVTNP